MLVGGKKPGWRHSEIRGKCAKGGWGGGLSEKCEHKKWGRGGGSLIGVRGMGGQQGGEPESGHESNMKESIVNRVFGGGRGQKGGGRA